MRTHERLRFDNDALVKSLGIQYRGLPWCYSTVLYVAQNPHESTLADFQRVLYLGSQENQQGKNWALHTW